MVLRTYLAVVCELKSGCGRVTVCVPGRMDHRFCTSQRLYLMCHPLPLKVLIEHSGQFLHQYIRHLKGTDYHLVVLRRQHRRYVTVGNKRKMSIKLAIDFMGSGQQKISVF